MKFRSSEHENKYNMILKKMNCDDVYHKSLAYLISCDSVCRNHINNIYDFKNHSIKSDCLNASWHTGSSIRTCRLAFNLWSGYNDLSCKFTVYDIFNYGSVYLPFYLQAISIRYDINV